MCSSASDAGEASSQRSVRLRWPSTAVWSSQRCQRHQRHQRRPFHTTPLLSSHAAACIRNCSEPMGKPDPRFFRSRLPAGRAHRRFLLEFWRRAQRRVSVLPFPFPTTSSRRQLRTPAGAGGYRRLASRGMQTALQTALIDEWADRLHPKRRAAAHDPLVAPSRAMIGRANLEKVHLRFRPDPGAQSRSAPALVVDSDSDRQPRHLAQSRVESQPVAQRD